MAVEVMTPEKVHHAISHMVSNGIPYIEAICEYAQERNLDIELVASVVKQSKVLKEKIRSEAIDLRMVKADINVIDITQLY